MTGYHPLLNFSFSVESIILRENPWKDEDFGARVRAKTSTTWKNSSSCVLVVSSVEFSLSVAPLVSWIDSPRNQFDPMLESVWLHARSSRLRSRAARGRRSP